MKNPAKDTKFDFLLVGHFGYYNIGDDLIGVSIIKDIMQKYPLAEIVLTVGKKYHLNCNSFLKRPLHQSNFSPLSISRLINRSDKFIIAGGTHFHDTGNAHLRYIKIFLFFLFISAYGSILGKPPILLGHGIGPISRIWNIFFTRIIFRFSSLIVVRDRDSFETVRGLGFEYKCIQKFDLTAPLLYDLYSRRKDILKTYTLAISLAPVYSIFYNDIIRDKLFIKEFSVALRDILNVYPTLNIKLFGFWSGNEYSESDWIEDLSDSLKDYGQLKAIFYDGNIGYFLNELQCCFAFVGMQYHGALISYLLGLPIIIIPYQEKCKSLAREIMLDDSAVLELDNLNSELIFKKINDLLSNSSKYMPKRSPKNMVDLSKESFDYI